jgi:hypothetical protein
MLMLSMSGKLILYHLEIACQQVVEFSIMYLSACIK